MGHTGGATGHQWDSFHSSLPGLAAGRVGATTRNMSAPTGQFQGPGVAGGTAPEGGGTTPEGGGSSNTHRLSLPVEPGPPLSPGRCSLEAAAPWAHLEGPNDSFQKFSAQEGLLGRKWIFADRLPVGAGRRGGNPTSGKASPGNHLQGPRTSAKEEEGKGGTLVFLHITAGGRAQPFIQEYLLGSYPVTGIVLPKQRHTRGGRQGPRTRSGLLSVQDSRLSPLPTLARKPLP